MKTLFCRTAAFITVGTFLLLAAAVGARAGDPAQRIPAQPPVRTTQATPVNQPVPQLVSVSQASTNPLSIPAGGSATVTLTGTGLDRITSAQVNPGGLPERSVTARLEPVITVSRPLTFTAGPAATPGNYTVQLNMDGGGVMILPGSVLTIVVVNPVARTPDLQGTRIAAPSDGSLDPGTARPGSSGGSLSPPAANPGGEPGSASSSAAPAARTVPQALQGLSLRTGSGLAPSSVPLSSIKGAGDQGGVRPRMEQPAGRRAPKPGPGTVTVQSPAQKGAEGAPSADRSGVQGGLRDSISRVSRPGAGKSGDEDPFSGSGSGSGLKSASGAGGTGTGDQGGDADETMPREVTAEEELAPEYAWLVENSNISRAVAESAARSGLTASETAELVGTMQLMGTEGKLEESGTWDKVAEEGGTEGVVKEAVAEFLGAPPEAAGVGLSPSEMLDIAVIAQKYGQEHRLEDMDTWNDAAKYGPGKVEGDAIREAFDIPDSVLPGAGPASLLNGVADIQRGKGDPSKKEDWDRFAGNPGEGDGSGLGTGSGPGKGNSPVGVSAEKLEPAGPATGVSDPGGTVAGPGSGTPGDPTSPDGPGTADGSPGGTRTADSGGLSGLERTRSPGTSSSGSGGTSGPQSGTGGTDASSDPGFDRSTPGGSGTGWFDPSGADAGGGGSTGGDDSGTPNGDQTPGGGDTQGGPGGTDSTGGQDGSTGGSGSGSSDNGQPGSTDPAGSQNSDTSDATTPGIPGAGSESDNSGGGTRGSATVTVHDNGDWTVEINIVGEDGTESYTVQEWEDQGDGTWKNKNTGQVTDSRPGADTYNIVQGEDGSLYYTTDEGGDTSDSADSSDNSNDSDDSSDDDSDSSDDSDDSSDDEDDSDDSGDDSGDGDDSSDDALPADPERFASSGMSAARRMAMVAKIRETETQPADPDRGGGSSAAPVLKDPSFGVVDPVDDGSGIRTGTTGSGVPDDPQSGGGAGPDPAGDESGASSSSGPHIPADLGGEMATASGTGSSGGGGPGGFGGGGSWTCYRALIRDSRGGLWCYCPISNDPVTAAPVQQWVEVADSLDAGGESLMEPGAGGGDPSGAGTPYCREYTEEEWRQAYPGESLPAGPPPYLVN